MDNIAKRIGSVVTALVVNARAMASDAVLFGGAASVVWGVHYWSVPAAWVVGGLMAVAIAIYGME